MARILIIGGKGFIGRNICGVLNATRYKVDAPSRRELDLSQADHDLLCARLEGVDTVINCAGLVSDGPGGLLEDVHGHGVARLLAAAKAAGVRRLIHISALGASTDGDTRYERTKAAGEAVLRDHPDGVAPECCVLRPSIVIGRGGASTTILAALAVLPVTPLIGAGRVQPIHIGDVVALVVRLMESSSPLPHLLDVTGPEQIGIDDVVRSLRQWLGSTPRLAVRMPAPLLTLMATLSGRFTSAPLNRETLAMLRHGNIASAENVARILGRPPRTLADALAGDPANGADRQAASVYFLRPVLRISLALMWIATGLLSVGLYPIEKSYELMAQIGLTGFLADVALYGAAMLDLILGVLLLINWRPRAVGAAQLATMAAFTLLAIGLPAEYWLHPFAPLIKNLPIAAATMVMMALED